MLPCKLAAGFSIEIGIKPFFIIRPVNHQGRVLCPPFARMNCNFAKND
jgi:hypothetical protein